MVKPNDVTCNYYVKKVPILQWRQLRIWNIAFNIISWMLYGQIYIKKNTDNRQTTQSNIKALDKDANTHNKRPALLGDPPTKRHKPQNQQTIPHQTRRPGLLGERPTNTATYTYNKTNWLSHRNTNTANNTNHPFPHKRVPLMSIKFTKPPTTTPQSHSKNYKRKRPHNPPKNTI